VLLRNELNGFPSIGGFGHNFEVRLLLQQEPQPGSNDRVVVSEQYANLSHARLPARPEYCIHVWNSEQLSNVRTDTVAELSLHKQVANIQNI
jgi:hypothetical protein